MARFLPESGSFARISRICRNSRDRLRGISSLTDLLSLLSLEPLGVTGVIVGRALYTLVLLTSRRRLARSDRAVGRNLPPNFSLNGLV
jgi:hypothetical protein